MLVSCGSDTKRDGFDPSAQPGSGSAGDPNGDFGKVEAGTPDAGPAVIGHLQGRVVAPEGTVPVSKAMVYLTTRP